MLTVQQKYCKIQTMQGIFIQMFRHNRAFHYLYKGIPHLNKFASRMKSASRIIGTCTNDTQNSPAVRVVD